MRIRNLIFFLIPASLIAQADAICGDPQVRYTDITCATQLLANANKHLDETYLSLSSRLDQGAKEKLKAEQQAWLQNRYAVKTFVYANSSEGGLQRELIAVNNELDDTLAREKQLKELLDSTK